MFGKVKAAATAVAIAGAVALGGAATASAGTAVVTGGGNVHATSPSARLVVNNAVALNCASGTANGSIASGTYTGAAPLTIPNPDLLIAFNTCVGPLGFSFNVTCTPTSSLAVMGNTAAGITPGRIENINCVVFFPAINCSANVTGTVDGAYNNNGTITVNGTYAQNLTVSGSQCSNVIPNGSAKFGRTGAGALDTTSLTYTLTNTGGFVRPQVAASAF